MEFLIWQKVHLFLPLLFGSLIGFCSKDDFSYLHTVPRRIHLPSLLFPIVWTVLYLLIGIYDFYDYKKKKESSNLYIISLFLNLVFTPLLFTFHLPFLATIDVILLFFCVAYLLIENLKNKEDYGYFLLPYLLWLGLALVLMIDIVSFSV